MEARTVRLCLSSNVIAGERYLGRALRSLMDDAPGTRQPILTHIQLSPVYETAPVGTIGPAPCLHAVVEGMTWLAPEDLLMAVKHIERELNRPGRTLESPEIEIAVLPSSQFNEHGLRLAARQWGEHPPDDTQNLIPCVAGTGQGGLGRITPSLIEEVCAALCTVGAVRIDPGIPPTLVEYFLHEASRLFELSDEIKLRSRRRFHSGYTPPNVEGVNGHGPDPLRHFWDIALDPEFKPEPETASFCSLARLVFFLLRDLAYEVFRIFDRRFGTEIGRSAINGEHVLRLSQYLNQTASPCTVLFPSHRDFGLLTAWLGGAAQGLQVKIHGAWHDVYNPIGSVVFGVGTTLRMFTPNDVPAICHRVVANQVGRLSAVLFTELRPDIRLPNGRTSGEHLARLTQLVRKENL